jgi:hypothetical protein
MVEIKDWLGSLRRNNGREREMSYGLFLVELNIWKRRGDHWRPGQWVFIFLGAQLLVMGGTTALTKIARIGNRKHGCFG